MSWPVARPANWTDSSASSRQPTLPACAGSHSTWMRVGAVVNLLRVIGEGRQAPDPGNGIVLAVLHEAIDVAQRRREVVEIGDLRRVDRLDEAFDSRAVHDKMLFISTTS